MKTHQTDYLVIGAGAAGMAFTDAVIDHDPQAHVTMVDRRPDAGGHWLDAYPFVQLHQASVFYGVASTVLGNGKIQTSGPEAGLQERASQREILTYFDDVLHRRLIGSGRVSFMGASDYQRDGSRHLVTSLESQDTVEIQVRRRLVDAAYLSPTIPALSPPPFSVGERVDVIAVNDLPSVARAPARFVMVGSGKTATDAIIWLLGQGVDPNLITWVRPRDPWMVDRAVVQPDPVVAYRLVADTLEAASEADSPDDLFLRLESRGVMFRIDPETVPSMAKTPTLARWELDLLRTVEDVVRLGHIRGVSSDEITFERGSVRIPEGSLIVHCAASGLRYPGVVPIWQPDVIRLQTIRAGFPCFNAALTGYVEATRDDDRERNRLCPANTLPNTPADWAWMQLRGAIASRAFGSEPDIASWMNSCALNPVRVSQEEADDPDLHRAYSRIAAASESGLDHLSRFARMVGDPDRLGGSADPSGG